MAKKKKQMVRRKVTMKRVSNKKRIKKKGTIKEMTKKKVEIIRSLNFINWTETTTMTAI